MIVPLINTNNYYYTELNYHTVPPTTSPSPPTAAVRVGVRAPSVRTVTRSSSSPLIAHTNNKKNLKIKKINDNCVIIIQIL